MVKTQDTGGMANIKVSPSTPPVRKPLHNRTGIPLPPVTTLQNTPRNTLRFDDATPMYSSGPSLVSAVPCQTTATALKWHPELSPGREELNIMRRGRDNRSSPH